MNELYAPNILVLLAGACLTPMLIYAEQMRLMLAVRILIAIPKNNVATAMLLQSFP